MQADASDLQADIFICNKKEGEMVFQIIFPGALFFLIIIILSTYSLNPPVRIIRFYKNVKLDFDYKHKCAHLMKKIRFYRFETTNLGFILLLIKS
jgi:hypothetical protein